VLRLGGGFKLLLVLLLVVLLLPNARPVGFDVGD
jgi:hypothetical protein